MKVSGQLHAPAALFPGKEPVVPIGVDTNLQRFCQNIYELDIISKFESCNVYSSINQLTSMRSSCCVYYRTECMPVVKFHAICTRCQCFCSMHCWCHWIYFSVHFGKLATFSCQTRISLESLYKFFSLAYSA